MQVQVETRRHSQFHLSLHQEFHRQQIVLIMHRLDHCQLDQGKLDQIEPRHNYYQDRYQDHFKYVKRKLYKNNI